jgi:hypothetical protein
MLLVASFLLALPRPAACPDEPTRFGADVLFADPRRHLGKGIPEDQPDARAANFKSQI